MFQRFFSGFLSVFRFGAVPIKNNPNTDDIAKYIDLAEKDLFLSYEKMKNKHERK
jgi:hypothetical protein